MKAESKKEENSQLIFNEDIPCPDGNIMFHVMFQAFSFLPFCGALRVVEFMYRKLSAP